MSETYLFVFYLACGGMIFTNIQISEDKKFILFYYIYFIYVITAPLTLKGSRSFQDVALKVYLACGMMNFTKHGVWALHFTKNSQLLEKKFHFNFLHIVFLCYYCSIDLKRQSEFSGLRLDISSLVHLCFQFISTLCPKCERMYLASSI